MIRSAALCIVFWAGLAAVTEARPAPEVGRTPRAADAQQRVRQSPARPAVRIVRKSPPRTCGAPATIVLEACMPMRACKADRIGRAQVTALDDALRAAAARQTEGACDAISCGVPRPGRDTNAFACRGTSRVCMTRTVSFSCAAPPAPQRTPPAPQRTSPEPQRTSPEPQRTAPTPQRTAPAPQRTAPAPRRVPSTTAGQAGPQRAPAASASASAGSPPIYQLHAFADDMAANERYYTFDHADSTTQKFGYDVTMQRRREDGTWTSLKEGVENHWDDPKNASYVIYNRPIYAMRDGTIMGCWRNARENPRPKLPDEDKNTPLADREWVHQDLRDRLMPGGGNEIWIKHDDGTYALYAHMRAGTIPSSLCPHDDEAYQNPVPDNATLVDGVVGPYILVPAAQRKHVKAGDFLGRVGNTGSSTGPHTHIHVQRQNAAGDWEGTPIRFARGLSTPWDDGNATLDGWTSFSGKSIPKGKVLFWPPVRRSKEYARHRLPAGDLQREFSHLANSGMAPEILDCYSVGGNVFYNMIWRPAEGPWRAYFGMTGSTIEQKFNDAKADGLYPVYIDSCSSKNGPRYAAVFEKVGGPYRWRYNIDADAHQAAFEKAWADGLHPVNVSVISINGHRRYTSLFRKVDYGATILKSQLDEAGYQQAVNDNKAAGRRPVYVAVYMHNGKPNFSAIFAAKPAGQWLARHDLSVAGYQAVWRSSVDDGLLTRTVSGYDGASSTHKFAAVWRK